MRYNHDDISARLQGVQAFSPPENLMGARGKPVIAEICAANNISTEQPAPTAQTVESFLKPTASAPGGMS